ncbi:MAG: CTP synthase [Defluviitaleaceae bacterium]|nr:CTP synthase [Defluviitaleaceae bacterium]MCL2274053.1 CTP synthase [Defluviitaleaceae bacterium]
MTRFIFITGGVVSGLGKGITAASLGRLLKMRGLRVTAQKLDPYMNIDPGTMSPLQHGEVFVTEDGAETDLDLGHYERFIDENLHKHSNLTSGKVYASVLARERDGGYLGGTVQMIPHVTGAIKDFIYAAAQHEVDVLISEIGGTVGDMESEPFLEAARQIAQENEHSCLFIHVTLVPYLKSSGEFKTKPTQHSVKLLRSMGITPNVIVLRSEKSVPDTARAKIAHLCNIKPHCIVENTNVASLYEAPLMLSKNGLDDAVCRTLRLETPPPNFTEWQCLMHKIASRTKTITIGIAGKYIQLRDAYLSIAESLHHAGFALGAYVEIKWIDSESISEESVSTQLSGLDGLIIPGGFGERGIEGKILACRYARENNLPFLGICMGMQVAVIEYARHVCGLKGAHSTECDPHTPHPVIHLMSDQAGKENSGGTLRLGAYPCTTATDSHLRALYNTAEISERHRHRYEFNNAYRQALTEKGLSLCGISPDETLVEAVEVPSARFHIGVQYHPEFKSRPNKAHPLFVGLLEASHENEC